MSRIDLVSKNLLANYFRNCRNRDNCWNNYDKLIYKNRKSSKCNEIQGLEREEIKEGPEMSENIAEVTNISLAK